MAAKAMLTFARCYAVTRLRSATPSFEALLSDDSPRMAQGLLAACASKQFGRRPHFWSPDPLRVLPTLPDSDARPAWLSWVQACSAAVRAHRANMRSNLKPVSHAARQRRRLAHLLRTAPKSTHRRNFGATPTPASNASTSTGIDVVSDQASQCHLT